MMIFSEPNILDIVVSLLIGLIAGGLISSLIFILVMKKRWEDRWEYYNKIKSISEIQLPQMAFDDSSLSKSNLQSTVIGNSSIPDKRFLERVWADDGQTNRNSSDSSLFLTQSDYDQIHRSHTYSHAAQENNRMSIRRSSEKTAEDIKPKMKLKGSSSTAAYFSGSTSGKASNEPDQRVKSLDDEDMPLAIRLNSLKN